MKAKEIRRFILCPGDLVNLKFSADCPVWIVVSVEDIPAEDRVRSEDVHLTSSGLCQVCE